MDIFKKFWRSVKGKCLIAVLVLLAAFAVHNALEGREGDKRLRILKPERPKEKLSMPSQWMIAIRYLGSSRNNFRKPL